MQKGVFAMSTYKRLFSLFLCLILLCALLPQAAPGARADGPDYERITNYTELMAACQAGGSYLLEPAADFGWPEGETELDVPIDLYLLADWTIPKNVTMKLSGHIQEGFRYYAVSSDNYYHTLTLNGCLELNGRNALDVNKLIVGGTLILNGNSYLISADEGELLSAGTIQVVTTESTPNFTFYSGPRFWREHVGTTTHWILHEGCQILGRETGSSGGEMCFSSSYQDDISYHPLVEAEGNVRLNFSLRTVTKQRIPVRGSLTLAGLQVRGNSSVIAEGSLSVRSLSLSCTSEIEEECARVEVPEGGTFALEEWEDQTNYGSSAKASGSTEILVNGTLRLGQSTHLDGDVHITGTGLIDARARIADGTNQPYFKPSGTSQKIQITDIILDRPAYTDLVAESLQIQKDWNIVPKLLTQPVDVTANAGDTVTFTVEAQYAASYQWRYYTGTNICSCGDDMGTGADTNSFTLTAKPEYDGYQFFCRVTSIDNKDKNSTRATLTVLSDSPIANPFLDVGENSYYYDAVVWAIGHQPAITTGTDETHFSPNQPCTRAQAVTFLWRAMGCPDPKSEESPFTDVDENAYYYKAMLWAVEHGVTAGTSSTSFSPNSVCSRSQMVTLLWRAIGSPDPGIEQSPFTDVDENAFYYKAMLWALEQGITTGTSGTSFSPNAACTRGQVVTFLYRAVGD